MATMAADAENLPGWLHLSRVRRYRKPSMSSKPATVLAMTLNILIATGSGFAQQGPLPAFTAQTGVNGANVETSTQKQTSPSENRVFRLDVRRVVVDVQVLDKKTLRAVQGLQPDDFIVEEDGVAQRLLKSGNQEELPLSVVMLFDLTDSVRPVLKSLAKGARQVLEHLKPEDEVAVMTYSASAQLLQGFTRDRDLTVAAIEKAAHMESGEAAFFNEGIYQAAAELNAAEPARRHAIIWLTDDMPNFPTEEVRARYAQSLGDRVPHTEKEAVIELLRTETSVSTMLQTSQISDSEFSLRLSRGSETMLNNMRYPPGEVHKYAQASGGAVVEGSGKRAREQLSELIDDLRTRYTLIYKPQNDKPKGKFCRLRVRLTPEAAKTHPHTIVAARQGYYR
jgi:VWFA-related protein